MPVKKRRSKARDFRITDSVIEAYLAGDHATVNQMLGVRPWQVPPSLLQHFDPPSPDETTVWAASWPRAVEIRRALDEAAGRRTDAT